MKFSHSLATKFKMELICLKTEEAQRVFQARSAQQRKEILANILNIPEVDEEDDFKTAILLDIYYDNLAFAVEQGFPWSQVCGFFHLVKDLMHSCTGKTLLEGITCFKEHTEKCSHLFSENNLKSLVNHVFITFFQHYKLYQYLLTQEREDDLTRCHCTIEPPLDNLPAFQDGIPEREWIEQQKLKEIDEKERARQREREEYYQEERRKATEQLDLPLSQLELSNESLTNEQLQRVIKETTIAQTNVVGASVRETLDQTQDSIEYKFLRASVVQEQTSPGRRSRASSCKTKKKK